MRQDVWCERSEHWHNRISCNWQQIKCFSCLTQVHHTEVLHLECHLKQLICGQLDDFLPCLCHCL